MAKKKDELTKLYQGVSPKVDVPLDINLPIAKVRTGPQRPTIRQALQQESKTLPDNMKNKRLESFTASFITTEGEIHHILEDNPKQQTKMLEDLSGHVEMPKQSSPDAPAVVGT